MSLRRMIGGKVEDFLNGKIDAIKVDIVDPITEQLAMRAKRYLKERIQGNDMVIDQAVNEFTDFANQYLKAELAKHLGGIKAQLKEAVDKIDGEDDYQAPES